MSQQSLRFLLVGATAWLSACGQGEPPRELRLELPDVITSKEPVLVHARAVAQDGTAREPSGKLDYRVAPADLATVGKGGVFTCNRSGEGSVALTVAGVEGRAKFACKLAARLEAPAKLSLDIASGEADAQWKVLDAAGSELDLPNSVISDRGNVVQSRAGRLVPGSVGTATLTLRVGDLSRKVDVEVVRTLKPEVLPIQQNRRISYSLSAGKYRLTLKLAAPHKVTVDWLGAPYCAYRGDGTDHSVDCTLQSSGSVSFDNPAFLLRGELTPSVEGVTLREVP
ncbi:MAG TPA: hypothetical protein VEQ58_11720 [Polyangiaceae bacterium]|nr:hypothetical protein [Polyangiaceae bacterium]